MGFLEAKLWPQISACTFACPEGCESFDRLVSGVVIQISRLFQCIVDTIRHFLAL
jgi:hypothetical protein